MVICYSSNTGKPPEGYKNPLVTVSLTEGLWFSVRLTVTSGYKNPLVTVSLTENHSPSVKTLFCSGMHSDSGALGGE